VYSDALGFSLVTPQFPPSAIRIQWLRTFDPQRPHARPRPQTVWKPRRVRFPGLAARFTRFARSSAYLVRVHRPGDFTLSAVTV